MFFRIVAKGRNCVQFLVISFLQLALFLKLKISDQFMKSTERKMLNVQHDVWFCVGSFFSIPENADSIM